MASPHPTYGTSSRTRCVMIRMLCALWLSHGATTAAPSASPSSLLMLMMCSAHCPHDAKRLCNARSAGAKTGPLAPTLTAATAILILAGSLIGKRMGEAA